MIAFAVALTTTAGAAACVKQQVIAAGNVGPSLLVEQFLRAANQKDLQAMGRLFGTKDGPIINRESRQAMEQRMFTIASVLRHQDFEIQAEQVVPGRTTEATRLTVRLTINEKPYTVPFVLVRHKDGWLVEQIGLEQITAPR